MIKKYVKRPVVIEAIQWDGDNFDEIKAFCEEAYQPNYPGRVVITTLEGLHVASAGDYIIKGVKGEFYPCKPDIFAATYNYFEEKGWVEEALEDIPDLRILYAKLFMRKLRLERILKQEVTDATAELHKMMVKAEESLITQAEGDISAALLRVNIIAEGSDLTMKALESDIYYETPEQV